MKKILLLLVMVFSAGHVLAIEHSEQIYKTKTSTIKIKSNCTLEGEMNCQDISYEERSNDGKTIIKLKGATWVNPRTISFYGYKFKVGDKELDIYLRNEPFSMYYTKNREIIGKEIAITKVK